MVNEIEKVRSILKKVRYDELKKGKYYSLANARDLFPEIIRCSESYNERKKGDLSEKIMLYDLALEAMGKCKSSKDIKDSVKFLNGLQMCLDDIKYGGKNAKNIDVVVEFIGVFKGVLFGEK